MEKPKQKVKKNVPLEGVKKHKNKRQRYKNNVKKLLLIRNNQPDLNRGYKGKQSIKRYFEQISTEDGVTKLTPSLLKRIRQNSKSNNATNGSLNDHDHYGQAVSIECRNKNKDDSPLCASSQKSSWKIMETTNVKPSVRSGFIGTHPTNKHKSARIQSGNEQSTISDDTQLNAGLEFLTDNGRENISKKKSPNKERRSFLEFLNEVSDNSMESVDNEIFLQPLNQSKAQNCIIQTPESALEANVHDSSETGEEYEDMQHDANDISLDSDVGSQSVHSETSEIASTDSEVRSQTAELDYTEKMADNTNTNLREKTNTLEYYNINGVFYVILRHPCKLYFNGVIKVQRILGKIEIFGYRLTANPEIVYSLQSDSFLFFESIANDSMLSDVSIPELIDLGLPENVINTLEPSDCILKMIPHNCTVVNFIDKYIPQRLLPKIDSYNDDIGTTLKCYFDSNSSINRRFQKSLQWDQAFIKIISSKPVTERNVTLVCGGKSVGKSTLLKYFSNKLLLKTDAVLWIDLDPGQPEFTVAECISATVIRKPPLGPSYTNFITPTKSIFLGENNVSHCLTRYIYAVKHLLHFCRGNEELLRMPWLVNTMGFVRGIGLEIIAYIIRTLQPTWLLQMKSSIVKQNFPSILSHKFIKTISLGFESSNLSDELSYEIIVLDAVVKKNFEGWLPTSAHRRGLRVLNYISRILQNEINILSVRPYIVKANAVKIIDLNQTLNENMLLSAMNANFVALCSEEVTMTGDIIFNCYGFGIVRGIDQDDIYLITPINIEELQKVNHLLLTAEPLPTELYTKFISGSLSYVSTFQRSQTTKIPQRSTFNPKAVIKHITSTKV